MSTIARPLVRPSGWRPTGGALTGSLVVALIALVLLLGWVDSWLGTPAYVIALACGIAIGWAAGPARREPLLLALVPATLLTNSAILPYSGRYLPALMVLTAFLASGRLDLPSVAAGFRRIPRPMLAFLVAYLGWMAFTTLTSTSRLTSATYLFGSLAMLGAIFVVVPRLPNPERVAHHLLVTLAIAALVIVLGGLVLFLAGSIHLYGRIVGLYFLEEAVLFGHRTGILFPQDYGPFIGPNTAPDGFGMVAALYLRSQTVGRARAAWSVAAAVLLLGLVSTFSREGWLIAALGCLALFAAGVRRGQRAWAPLALAVTLLILAGTGLTNTLGVVGRLDLVRSWYGPEAPAILLNPDLLTRGDELPPDLAGLEGRSIIKLKDSSSLSARLSLWRAAIAATRRRPVLGYGAGTDAVAIVPYLKGDDARLRGATTHSTFFRIAVEMGVPGVLIYLGFTALAAWYAIRRLWVGPFALAVLGSTVIGMLPTQFTGTLILGGFSFPGFWLALVVSLLMTGSLAASRPAQAPETGWPS